MGYSIAPHPGQGHEVGRAYIGGYSTIPAYLSARLALHRTLHRQGLGGELLYALEMVVAASDTAAGRLIVVDAIDDAAVTFYERYDFIRSKGTMRLAMKLATARRALGIGK